jgi:hypothetical protein
MLETHASPSGTTQTYHGAPTPAPAPSTPKYLSKDQLDTYLNANYGELSNAFSQVGSQYGFTNLNDFANAQYINHGYRTSVL